MSDAPEIEATINALLAVAAPAFNAKSSPYFQEEEAERLRADAQMLWSRGHWLYLLLQHDSCTPYSTEPDIPQPTRSQLDEVLANIILSAFRIGAASVVHPANERHLDSIKMENLRNKKARSPLQMKRDRIKKTVLPPLLARKAPRHEQLTELNKALSAENAGEISQEQADRWRKQIQKVIRSPKNL